MATTRRHLFVSRKNVADAIPAVVHKTKQGDPDGHRFQFATSTRNQGLL